MDNNDNFALVPKPPGALEKAQPGAKRILSGIIADALALVKQDSLQEATFTVLLGSDHRFSTMESFLARKLGGTHKLRFFYFARSSELVKLAEGHPFDLIFTRLGLFRKDIASYGGRWRSAADVRAACKRAADILGDLKARYGKPIVATLGLDLSAELEPKGVIFLQAPFAFEDFWTRLQPHLATPVSNWTSKRTFSVAICGLNPGYELELLFFTHPLQEILGSKYAVTLHYFESFRQCDATIGGYNLFVIFLNPVLLSSESNGEVDPHKLVAELKTKFQKPVIILTNGGKYDLDSAVGFRQAGADAFFSFLPPFPTKAFKETLATCVAKSQVMRDLPEMPVESAVRLGKARP